MLYIYFSGPDFPAMNLPVLIFGTEASTHENKTKGGEGGRSLYKTN